MEKVVFSWLHLSDIHFQQDNDSFNDAQIRSTLPEYLASCGLQLNAIILSGDYRYAPKREHTSPDDVVAFLQRITEILKIDNNKVIMVPGNHDLSRSEARKNHINGTRKTYDPNDGTIDSTVLKSLTKDFTFFDSVQEHFNCSLKVDGPNPHAIINMDNCYLLLFNTALIAGQDDDEHHIIIGSKYINDLLDTLDLTTSKPIIAVGHHGFDFFDHAERKVVTQYLEKKGVHLYLCGHEHSNGTMTFYEEGKQVNVGCLKQGTHNVDAGFSVGSLYNNGDVDIEMHKWDRSAHSWVKDTPNTKSFPKLYPDLRVGEGPEKVENQVKKTMHPFSLIGYSLIGGLGSDGIKYFWEKNGSYCVESIAFNKRLKLTSETADLNTSAYNISTSIGCPLSGFGHECVFCQTGTNQYMPLTADDIALQCIFMAEYDSDCHSYPLVKDHAREFAFMGQGEAGCCYDSIKKAIRLNDYVMKQLGQRVSRYIISTCGITDFLTSFIQDCKNGIFENKVTLHFSLNTIDNRNLIMPINKLYDYQSFITECRKLYEVTGDKIGVGILLFGDYKTYKGQSITLDANKLNAVLDLLDSKIFKIDLCTVNKTDRGSQKEFSNEEAHRYLEIATSRGFESKIFASFGDSESAGCGMLCSSRSNINEPGNTTILHFNRAVELLLEAKQNVV